MTAPDSNGQAPQPQLPPDALSPEVQSLFIEALFWRQKYMELREHTNQVISMLSRPPAGAEQMAGMLGGQPPQAAAPSAQMPQAPLANPTPPVDLAGL